MNRNTILLSLLLIISTALFAQTAPVDTSWKNGGFFGLTFSQVGLSNWAQGGDQSLALSAKTNLFANYIKGKADWQNTLDLAYAMVQTGTDKLKKSDDKIDFTSKYSRKFSEHWLYSILFNFKSQFADGFNYPNDSIPISKFFSPAYVTLSPGLTYKPVDYFEILFSPATAKWTFVTDQLLSDAGAYGVDSGKTVRTEVGAYLNLYFKKDIMENINFTSKLELFNNYTAKNVAFGNGIDVNWENTLNMKVNKYFTASFYTQLIYDTDVIDRTQFKETIGIGFGYKF